MTCSANAKEKTLIKKLEYDITARKKAFGFDYLTMMMEEEKTAEELQECLDKAKLDIEALREQIAEKEGKIGANKETLQKKIEANATGGAGTTPAPAPAASTASTPAPAPAAPTPAPAATT